MIDVSNSIEASTTMVRFVTAVKAKMETEGITQIELANRLGSQRQYVSSMLKLKAGNLSFKTADEIATALGTTTAELISGN